MMHTLIYARDCYAAMLERYQSLQGQTLPLATAYRDFGMAYHFLPSQVKNCDHASFIKELCSEAFTAHSSRELPQLVQIFGTLAMILDEVGMELGNPLDDADLHMLGRQMAVAELALDEARERVDVLNCALGIYCDLKMLMEYHGSLSEKMTGQTKARRRWMKSLPRMCFLSGSSSCHAATWW
jgi:hypothetical protein